MLEEFDKRVEALEVEEQEFPQGGYEFWFITSSGDVTRMFWHADLGQEQSLAIGNVFKTEAEAEFAVEKLKVEAELRKFGRPFEVGEENWLILFSPIGDEIVTNWSRQIMHQGTIYFESGQKAQQAIESVGEERIKKYIFGVEAE